MTHCLPRPLLGRPARPLPPYRIETATGRVDPSIVGRISVSSGDAWSGMRLDQVTLAPAEQREGYLDYHALMVHVGSPMEIEGSWSGEPCTVHRLAPGAVTLFPAWEPYKTRWDRPLEYVCVRVAPQSVAAVNEESGTAVLRHRVAVEDNLVPALVMALRKEAQDRSTAGSLYVESLGAALIAHLVREYGSGSRTDVRFRGGLPLQRLRRVQDYIEANLSAELHLAALSRVAEVSVRHFVRAFKESTGVSPHQFVLGRRMEHARSLLAGTTLTIADVALRCGFGSPSRFAAAFRHATDLAPAAYRKVVLPG